MITYPETSARLVALTEAWRALLTDCPLPAPAVVSLEPTVNRITIQAGGRQDPLDHLAELLLWAYTLEQVTAQWWHTSDGHLHLTIHGRTPTGVAVKIYGGIPFAHCAGLFRWLPMSPRVCRWMRSTRCSACCATATRPSPWG